MFDLFGFNARREDRRLEREAYLEAIRVIARSQESTNDLIKGWLEMFKTNSAPEKGWVNDDRSAWLQEKLEEVGADSVPMGLSHGEQLKWLEDELARD